MLPPEIKSFKSLYVSTYHLFAKIDTLLNEGTSDEQSLALAISQIDAMIAMLPLNSLRPHANTHLQMYYTSIITMPKTNHRRQKQRLTAI